MVNNIDLTSQKNEDKKNTSRNSSITKDNGISNGIYGLAFIGAAIYFIQHATSFWIGVLGVIKAIIWPAILIYKLLEFLQM